LIDAMEELAPLLNGEQIIAQAASARKDLQHLELVEFLDPESFSQIFSEARLIVSHAGMGTIISALTEGKKIIVMPRIAERGEHRNNHQISTAAKMLSMNCVLVAYDKESLREHIFSNSYNCDNERKISNFASKSLVSSIEEFIKQMK
jgi:UDP-N-acetylglucosamine transferase subunit ALG13